MTGETRTSFEPSAPVRAAHKTVAVVPALVAIALGVFILLGTGFAQPNPAKRIIKVPSGSRCLSGFNVRRPARWAVSSPN